MTSDLHPTLPCHLWKGSYAEVRKWRKIPKVFLGFPVLAHCTMKLSPDLEPVLFGFIPWRIGFLFLFFKERPLVFRHIGLLPMQENSLIRSLRLRAAGLTVKDIFNVWFDSRISVLLWFHQAEQAFSRTSDQPWESRNVQTTTFLDALNTARRATAVTTSSQAPPLTSAAAASELSKSG